MRQGRGPKGRPGGRGAGWGVRSRCGAVVLAAILVPVAVGAQEGRAADSAQVAPDSLAAATDTILTPADSARLRVFQRLGRLSRPPGVDSVALLAMEDSLALLDAQQRPGAPPPRRVEPVRGGGAAGGDTTVAALAVLEGYSITEYTGESAQLDSNRRLLLIGTEESQAMVRREEGEVRSDTVIYDPRSQRMRTQGGEAVLVPSQGDELTSETLIFDTGEQRGTALGATTTYSQGGTEWTVFGDLPSVNTDVIYGSHTRFTSCQEDEPHYHFQAGEVKIHGGNWLVARPVKLYFGDVPVAWLPFIAQGLGAGRRSGILTPRFSINDIVRNDAGYSRRISNVGFYWATNDYMDMALALDWWDDNYTALTGTFRYGWRKQFLQGGVNYRNFWRTDGSTELTMDTQHSWAPDERTSVSFSGRFSSNNDFVRENTFDPREVTGSIDSNGGLSRRFDWGTMTLGANRRQFLSDDRVETTVPTANLSLSPMTFLAAPSNRASWFNNLTWSGGGSLNRSETDVSEVPDELQTPTRFDQVSTRASARSTFNLGALSFGQTMSFAQSTERDKLVTMPEEPDTTAAQTLLAPILYGQRSTSALDETFSDVSSADLNWSLSLDYQQTLVGSTTITPAIAISGRGLRSDELAADSVPEAANFVSAPPRISAGAQLKTDIYGFWPGFSGFEAVRHKFSPSFTWSYTPGSTPSELQRRVFNSTDLTTRNTLRVGLNQTFEAKRKPQEEEEGQQQPLTPLDSLAVSDSLATDSLTLLPDSAAFADDPNGPRRQQQASTVKLLAINTSAVTYDFVRADSLGSFDQGFETTRITNQISSDFLRGFTISMEHELFEDVKDSTGFVVDRNWEPHLSQLNLGFSLGSNSGIFRFLRGGEEAPEEPYLEGEDPFAVRSGTDEAGLIPGSAGDGFSARDQRRQDNRGAGVGGWNTNFTYSLTRPRNDAFGPKNQMVQWTLTFKPTEKWDVSWRSSYDVEMSRFNDHIMRLSRDLHRWEANFDFRQTATGNWTFRFEVALIDNRDLKFDYKQRDLDAFGN